MHVKRFAIEEKGAALIWVILLFMVLMILVPSTLFLSRQSLTETVNQENKIKAYYVALSGVDLTYAALLSTVDGNLYIKKFEDDSNLSVTSTINVPENGSEGKAEVKVYSRLINGERWIQIISKGSLSNGSNMTSETGLRIKVGNRNYIFRESKIN